MRARPAPQEEEARAGGQVAGVRVRPWTARLRRLYLTLRTEHTTRGKVALAVAIGVFVGCSPFWGLHFALSVAAATLFRLNRMLVYAAANLANPLTAPFLVFAEVQVGHRLVRGAWLGLSLEEFLRAGLAGLSVDLLVGSLVLGAAAALLLGPVAWLIGRASVMPGTYQELIDRVVRLYLAVGIRDAEAARARLLRDPIYPFLLDEPAPRRARRILDLGCGRGLVAALLASRPEPVPAGQTYLGVDVLERYVRVGREALRERPGVAFETADLRDFDPPPADLVLLLNSLRYLPVASQDALLRRLGRALPAGARLFVREMDAGSGWRFSLTLLRDTLVRLVPGRPRYRPGYRRASDLRNALIVAGFEVTDRTTLRSTSRTRVFLEAVRTEAPPTGSGADASAV